MGLLVIFTKTARSRDGSHESGPRLRGVRRTLHSGGVAEYNIEGTWGSEVLDELEPGPNERQVIKYRPSAFIGTTLDLILRNRSIRAAVVIGVSTHNCVESTVRDLEQYGYYPVILSDCVSTSRQDLHEAGLLVMSARYDVVTSEELFKVWHSAR